MHRAGHCHGRSHYGRMLRITRAYCHNIITRFVLLVLCTLTKFSRPICIRPCWLSHHRYESCRRVVHRRSWRTKVHHSSIECSIQLSDRLNAMRSRQRKREPSLWSRHRRVYSLSFLIRSYHCSQPNIKHPRLRLYIALLPAIPPRILAHRLPSPQPPRYPSDRCP